MVSRIVFKGDFEGYLATKADRIIAALRAETKAATQELISYINNEKLSGQVLNQRTGNLKRSSFTEYEEVGTMLEGTAGYGRTVPYAAIHNYGGKIEVPAVEGKLMVFQGSTNYQAWGGIFESVAQSKALIFTTHHRAFTVNMPARNYLESSLAEEEPKIMAEYQAAVDEAVAE